jgi:hypothetical protein
VIAVNETTIRSQAQRSHDVINKTKSSNMTNLIVEHNNPINDHQENCWAPGNLAPSSNSSNNDTQTKFTTLCHKRGISTTKMNWWIRKQLSSHWLGYYVQRHLKQNVSYNIAVSLLVEDTGVSGENHPSATRHWQTLTHKVEVGELRNTRPKEWIIFSKS